MKPPPIEENEKEKCPVSFTQSVQPNLQGDWLNFFLLLLMYTMQGFPMGLTSAVPILMQNKNDMSYQDQALFSLVVWPFSLKLFWAPLVDALYIQRIGRRKSWLVPVQYLMGVSFLYMAKYTETILPKTGKPDIYILLSVFFIANFLAATQDIAVDGWALTILKKTNVGYASTCNTTGQTIGVMFGSMLPILLTSEDFCNRYFWVTTDESGIISMKSFLYFWGILFIFVTTCIAIFKKEKDCTLDEDHIKLNVVQNYLLLWNILKLPSIQVLAMALLTVKVGFSVTENVTYLKLIDDGISKDDIAIINTAMCLIKLIIPFITSKYTSGTKPMSIYLNSTTTKLLWSFTFVGLIYVTPYFITTDADGVAINIPFVYYIILICLLFVDEVLTYIMFVALLAFFSRISDPRFGGTYITLLNTITNLGCTWTSTVALGMIDLLTFRVCTTDSKNYCSTPHEVVACDSISGDCNTLINGYYLGTLLSVIFGFFWYGYFRNILKNLQTLNAPHWMVSVKQPVSDNIENSSAMTVS